MSMRSLSFVAILALSACSDSDGSGSKREELWLLWDHFAATGETEILEIPANAWGGITADREYSGLVALEIEGTATLGPRWVVDAFYASDDNWASHTGPAMILYYSFMGCTCQLECDGRDLSRLLVFAEGFGNLPPNCVASYSATHSYAVVIDLGSTPVQLTLGVGDCGTFDNTGGFTIRLTPVARIR